MPRCGRGYPSAWPSLHPWQPWCCLQFRLQSLLVPDFSLLTALLCLGHMGLAGGGEDASGALPPRPCSWAHENHSAPHHAFGARGALRCGRLTGTHLLEALPASLSAQGLPNICLLCSLSFLGTVVPASFLFLPLEQGSVPMCACSSHPVHTPSSQGLGFRSSSPFSIF